MRTLSICLFALVVSGLPALGQQVNREWRFYIDQFGSADRSIRDIDATAITVSTPMVSNEPFTFGLQAGLVSTSGQSIEPGDIAFSPASALGVYAGGYIRISPPDEEFVTPFAEGGIAFLVFDKPFPQHPSLRGNQGKYYGKFDIRWGVDFRLNPTVQLEAAFALNHISNGSGFGAQNINFDGVGFSLGVVREW